MVSHSVYSVRDVFKWSNSVQIWVEKGAEYFKTVFKKGNVTFYPLTFYPLPFYPLPFYSLRGRLQRTSVKWGGGWF